MAAACSSTDGGSTSIRNAEAKHDIGGCQQHPEHQQAARHDRDEQGAAQPDAARPDGDVRGDGDGRRRPQHALVRRDGEGDIEPLELRREAEVLRFGHGRHA